MCAEHGAEAQAPPIDLFLHESVSLVVAEGRPSKGRLPLAPVDPTGAHGISRLRRDHVLDLEVVSFLTDESHFEENVLSFEQRVMGVMERSVAHYFYDLRLCRVESFNVIIDYL